MRNTTQRENYAQLGLSFNQPTVSLSDCHFSLPAMFEPCRHYLFALDPHLFHCLVLLAYSHQHQQFPHSAPCLQPGRHQVGSHLWENKLNNCKNRKFFFTNRSGQTVQTQIRLLLEKQSDQGLHCLPFHWDILLELPYGLASLFEF